MGESKRRGRAKVRPADVGALLAAREIQMTNLGVGIWPLVIGNRGLGHSEHRHCASPLSRRSPGGFVRARFLSGGEGEGRGHPWRHPLISRFSNTEPRNLPYFRVLSTRPATGNLHLVNWRLARQSMRCPPPFLASAFTWASLPSFESAHIIQRFARVGKMHLSRR